MKYISKMRRTIANRNWSQRHEEILSKRLSTLEKTGKLALSDEDIVNIREDDRTQVEIAKAYNVSQSYISQIKMWKKRTSARKEE